MPAGIFLTPNCLRVLEGHTTYQGAWYSYNAIRASLGKTIKQKITIEDYCKVEGVTPQQVLAAFAEKKR